MSESFVISMNVSFTFVMRYDSSGNFYLAARWNIARRRLQEEEWFLWYGVIQFLNMLDVVTPDGYNLGIHKFNFTSCEFG